MPSIEKSLDIKQYKTGFDLALEFPNWDLENSSMCLYVLFLTAAVVEGTIFCAHAGLSPQLYDLDLVS